MTLSKPRVIVDMLYNSIQHIHDRSCLKDQDEWLVEAIKNAEQISTELARPERGITRSFFYDLAYHAVNCKLSIDEFYCILKLYNIILY